MIGRLLKGYFQNNNNKIALLQQINRSASSTNGQTTDGFNINDYHEASDNTLEELSDRLESVLESRYDEGADVCLSNGVLTVTVDDNNTYVINKQTPNRQIWLSSPLSGPMRFDFVEGKWIEKYTRNELRQLLSKEMSEILQTKVDC